MADNKRTHTPVEGYQLEELRTKSIKQLIGIAEEVGVENPSDYRRQDLIFGFHTLFRYFRNHE